MEAHLPVLFFYTLHPYLRISNFKSKEEFYKLLIHPWKNLSIHRIIYFWIRMTLAPSTTSASWKSNCVLASAAPGLRSPPASINRSHPHKQTIRSCTPSWICIPNHRAYMIFDLCFFHVSLSYMQQQWFQTELRLPTHQEWKEYSP